MDEFENFHKNRRDELRSEEPAIISWPPNNENVQRLAGSYKDDVLAPN